MIGYQANCFSTGDFDRLSNWYRKYAKNKDKETVLAGQVFGNIEIIEGELDFVVRFDRLFELNPNGEKVSYLPYASDAPSNMILLGVQLMSNQRN